MCREPVLADRNAFNQPRCNHPPADEALQAAKRQQSDHAPFQRALESAGQPEESQRDGDEKTDAAGQNAMRPFPPEDALERVERHALVELLILWDLLVFFEFFLPFAQD